MQGERVALELKLGPAWREPTVERTRGAGAGGAEGSVGTGEPCVRSGAGGGATTLGSAGGGGAGERVRVPMNLRRSWQRHTEKIQCERVSCCEQSIADVHVRRYGADQTLNTRFGCARCPGVSS